MRLRDIVFVAGLVSGCEETGVESVVEGCGNGTLSPPARAAVPLDVYVVNNSDGMNEKGCSVYATVDIVRGFMSQNAGIDLVPEFIHMDFKGSASDFLRYLMLPDLRATRSQLVVVYGFDLGEFEKYGDPWGLNFLTQGVTFLDLDPPRSPNSPVPCIGLDVIMAHEIGHALGLEHRGGEGNLMNSPSENLDLDDGQVNLIRCVAGHYFGLPVEDGEAN